MLISLDKFRAKLVIKILYARSTAEVERFIRAGVKAMERKKIDGETISHFVDRVINQLSIFQLSKTSPLKWENIRAATTSLLQIRSVIAA